MKVSNALLDYLHTVNKLSEPLLRSTNSPRSLPVKARQCLRHPLQRRFAHNPADRGDFISIVDNPVTLVKTRKSPWKASILVLAAIPLTAFALGSWQVQRLGWKTDLIARFEDRLVRDPLPLPREVDPSRINEFDYRRVYTVGKFRHDQEMLIGPRTHDGEDGFLVVTPLDRGEDGTQILVNRGWISKARKTQASREVGLPRGDVLVQGLLREPWIKNMFTPDNIPEKGEFYFPNVAQMAALTGSQPVWIESTMAPDMLTAINYEAKGIPIGRAAEVNLRNNHTQYIFTWYALSFATSIMFYMVVKKPPTFIQGRVRRNTQW